MLGGTTAVIHVSVPSLLEISAQLLVLASEVFTNVPPLVSQSAVMDGPFTMMSIQVRWYVPGGGSPVPRLQVRNPSILVTGLRQVLNPLNDVETVEPFLVMQIALRASPLTMTLPQV